MAISNAQISAAADELNAAGLRPTLVAVRALLGGGSFTTISPALAEWRASKSAPETPARNPLPPAIGERLASLGADMWASALQLANSRLDGERDAFECARAQMTAGRTEVAELADQLLSELDDFKTRLSAMTKAEVVAGHETRSLLESLSSSELSKTRAEARVEEMTQRIADLNAELTRVNAHNGELVMALVSTAQPPPTGAVGSPTAQPKLKAGKRTAAGRSPMPSSASKHSRRHGDDVKLDQDDKKSYAPD